MTTGRINQVVSGDEQGTPALTQAGRQPATAAAAAADAARQGAPEPSLTHRFGAGGNAFASPSPPAFTHRYTSLSLTGDRGAFSPAHDGHLSDGISSPIGGA